MAKICLKETGCKNKVYSYENNSRQADCVTVHCLLEMLVGVKCDYNILDMRTTKEKIIKDCVVCGKKIKVTIYPNGKYRGGHYFGEISTGKNKQVEYWECPACYYDYCKQKK